MIQHGLFVHGRNKNQLQCIPKPHSNFSNLLSPKLQDLFIRCFDDGHFDPDKRPDTIEWRDAILQEIQRINQTPVTAGGNQPATGTQRQINPAHANPGIQPQANPIQPQPVLHPQPAVVIHSFNVAPGGVNQAILSWNVSNAVTVLVNNMIVGHNGTMQILAANGHHKIEAIDNRGLKTSQSIMFNLQLNIIHFTHQVCNGYIQLLWDVQGATSVSINQNVVAATGSLNLPLSVGTHTIVAVDTNGYTLSNTTHINSVALIRDFSLHLYRKSALLIWDVWNASFTELSGQPVSSIGQKVISLKADTYTLNATDSFGNLVTQSLPVNVSGQPRLFDIIMNQYTALVKWDVWYVKSVTLDGQRIPLKGDKIIPLLSKPYVIEFTDYNGLVQSLTKNLNAPANVQMKPPVGLSSVVPVNSGTSVLSTGTVNLNSSVDLNNNISGINSPLSLSNSPVSLNNSLPNLNQVVPLYFKKAASLKLPVTMNQPVKSKNSIKNSGQSVPLSGILPKAAAFVGFYINFFK